jgi:hypothetical protein
MRILMNFLMVCAIFGTLSANALAGGDNGGGAKDDGSIVVENDFDGYVMAVIVGDGTPNTVTEFLAEGAQFVQPGDSVSFDVSGGTHTVTALFIQDVSPFQIITATTNVNVNNNSSVTVTGVAPGDLID